MMDGIPHPDRALAPGSRLDEYLIESLARLEDGAIVYRARGRDAEPLDITEYYPVRIVEREAAGALRVSPVSHEPVYLAGKARFLETGRKLAGLRSRNLPRVIRVFEHNHTAYLVSPADDAVTLADIFQQTPVLDGEDLTGLIFPILDALNAVHQQGLLHLAITPECIHIRGDGVPLLTGFGCRQPGLPGPGSGVPDRGLAPELDSGDGHELGPWTDIYALGAVFYRCLAGTSPGAKAAGDVPGGVAAGVWRVVEHALVEDPRERPQTVSAWLQEFLDSSMDLVRPSAGAGLQLEPASLPQAPITPDPEAQADPQPEPGFERGKHAEDIRQKLFTAFLGGKRLPYYLGVMLQQDAHGLVPRISWNNAACALGLLWLLYRRMPMYFLLYSALLGGITVYLIHPALQRSPDPEFYLFVDPATDASIAAFLLLAALLSGLFGNYIYYLHAAGTIRRAAARFASVAEQRRWLSARPGTSWPLVVVVVVIIAAGAGYGHRQLLARRVLAEEQVSEALAVLMVVRGRVEDYRREFHRWPEDAGEVLDRTDRIGYRYVGEIAVIRQLVVVSFGYQTEVLPAFAGKSLAMVGQEANGRITWTCGSIDLPLQYLPGVCRTSLK